jgi:FlaA1/EpsC-like NDP-sugar epimerase
MSTFALGTGLIALCIYHGKIIMQKKSGYFVSIILFISMLMLFVSYYAAPNFANYLYNEIYTPLSIAIICFTAFYNYTAIYRAFRIRNIDAAVFAFAAVFLMMLYAPIFEIILPQTATVANWILDVPNMGASRGVIIGVALGTIAIAIRVLLGYERAYTG